MITGFYLKQDMQKVLHAWNTDTTLPRKGRKLVVAFPANPEFSTATITVHGMSTITGKRVYRCEIETVKEKV